MILQDDIAAILKLQIDCIETNRFIYSVPYGTISLGVIMTHHHKWVLHPFYPISLALSQRKHTASKLAFHVWIFINKIYTKFAQADAPRPFLTTYELFLKQSNFIVAYFTLKDTENILQNMRLKHNADAQMHNNVKWYSCHLKKVFITCFYPNGRRNASS